MHTRAIVLSFRIACRGEGGLLLFYPLLHLPFPPLPLSFHSWGIAKPVTTQRYLSFEFATRRFQILRIQMKDLIVYLIQ